MPLPLLIVVAAMLIGMLAARSRLSLERGPNDAWDILVAVLLIVVLVNVIPWSALSAAVVR